MAPNENYLRDRLLNMSESDRQVLLVVTRNAINRDPHEEQPFTTVMVATYLELCDLLIDLAHLDDALRDVFDP